MIFIVQTVDSLITSADCESVRFILTREIIMFFTWLVTIRCLENCLLLRYLTLKLLIFCSLDTRHGCRFNSDVKNTVS